MSGPSSPPGLVAAMPTAAAAVPPTTVTPAAAAPSAAARCDNCGAAVSGRYCGTCGQRVEPPVHSLWHFTKVAAEDLTHADSRLWRTLAALLFRPGYLTSQFLAGRRAAYLPPVRLYLVLSVLFFIWASATQRAVLVTLDSEHGVRSAEINAEVGGIAKEAATPFGAARPGETPQQRAERVCRSATYNGPWRGQLAPLVPRACRRVVEDNGRSLGEAFLHNVPRAMFLFLPLLAGAMMLVYWRPRRYYVEHLLLLVHVHAFVFLLRMLAWALAALLFAVATWVQVATWLYIPWYLYRSMRVVYGQGRALTAAKFVLLSFFYLVSGSLMLALTTVYSVLTL
jgi:hypothetical protein